MQGIYLILLTLSLMVFGQVMSKIGSAQETFFNAFVLLGYIALTLRGITWIFVLRRFPLSFAYPFMSLAFVFILIFSYYLFGEEITVFKLVGSFFLILGVTLTAKANTTQEG